MNILVRITGLVSTLCVLDGCQQGAPPRELRLELPELITSKEPVMVHARAVQQDGIPSELRGEQPFQIAPAELASMGKGGMLTCNRSGEGSVTLVVSGVTGKAKFACKLAARLEAPAKLSIDAAGGELDVPAKVFDAAGRELDLPISVTTNLASVVQARSGRLVPGNVGHAKLALRAGQLSKQIEVEVVRTIKPEVVPIDQNRRISYSLERGKYRLSIKLPAPHKVVVDWLSAPYCAYRGAGAEHRIECTLQHKGGVSFDNPAFLLRGEKMPSIEGVALHEVP
jgi:hypothetical protein